MGPMIYFNNLIFYSILRNKMINNVVKIIFFFNIYALIFKIISLVPIVNAYKHESNFFVASLLLRELRDGERRAKKDRSLYS